MMQSPPIRRALISVSDKLGLADFARALVDLGVSIYSTGGTRRHLEEHGVEVHDVSDYTGFPEMMDGRLKTLHPKVFGGLLCRHDIDEDMQSISRYGIHPFELVVVNLYPFEATISRPHVTEAEAIEQIDIGGPSLVRAAAKNYRFVTIATRPEQYSSILVDVTSQGHTSLNLRRRLAGDAFTATAAYDRTIAEYFSRTSAEGGFPVLETLVLRKKADLRYGENPHQRGAVYSEVDWRGPSLTSARQLNGKELSYNNILDLDSALAIVRSFAAPACAVIKHTNPCGAAAADHVCEAGRRALEGDPQSAFGSVLGFNRTIDVETAEMLCRPGLFIEAIVAPDYEAAAVGMLTTRPKWKDNVRLMQVGRLEDPRPDPQFRQILGGMLVQEADVLPDIPSTWEVVTQAQPDESVWRDLEFGWNIVRHIKSNAIAVCQHSALWGSGAGQMSRVDSVEIALRKAGRHAQGGILASDAFFPFPDSIERAAAAGIAAIIQPGGSRRDDEVIAACNQFGMPMLFTHRRHFKH
jgi:phosphoribosylaminoimidazolecarboxamide formyltransferase / IMP cyclohydrolase